MVEKNRVHIFVTGRVQGVFFRENTKRKAEKLGILSWIKNLIDGRVEAVFEGKKEKVEEITSWLKRGPFLAKVDNLEIDLEEYQGEFNNFEIK